MTTIAYKDHILAADTQGTKNERNLSGGLVFVSKIAETRYGALALCGGAGAFWFLRRLIPEIKDKDTFEAAIEEAAADGWFGDYLFVPSHSPDEVYLGTTFQQDTNAKGERSCVVLELAGDGHGFVAIGSGCNYALGAMAHGASAEEAVAIASRFDLNTNANIDTWTPVRPNDSVPE